MTESVSPPARPSGNDVAEVFADRCVLVTGASGFLGKVLVEKLLHSMPRIQTIYLLIRATKHETAAHRLEKLLQVCCIFLYYETRCTPEVLLRLVITLEICVFCE